ncbi:protein-lysine 6-oxidase [Platysternon megacephalum]|uniref:Protein-lysine 6-oxidase n=1 Tax=Platysternon megacephalum TaxID=55544 RepID=A0A4D9F676_9SAUR|nr:protein-lysine 6-oxidase [Platysternon megacephalum]
MLVWRYIKLRSDLDNDNFYELHVYVDGGKSREKVVKILVSMTPDEVLEKLKKEATS